MKVSIIILFFFVFLQWWEKATFWNHAQKLLCNKKDFIPLYFGNDFIYLYIIMIVDII